MSENEELQTEEIEVLQSIYEGDEFYTNPEKCTHQYKFGEAGSMKTFILEIKWTESYPTDLPTISLESFYNKHILPAVKEEIIKAVTGNNLQNKNKKCLSKEEEEQEETSLHLQQLYHFRRGRTVPRNVNDIFNI